ncbi:hypothetical protein KIPB_003837 [Kipferlia bialata]|uniref:Uncharacterized protein n=1 Tax=Kipferlia bialata TaxID=797122 RepID=A0A9K3GG44_9EUKA|nr:hypothetical protein KIPB_003837 [Kipferlia bialata]|eukprot:g3837.t1
MFTHTQLGGPPPIGYHTAPILLEGLGEREREGLGEVNDLADLVNIGESSWTLVHDGFRKSYNYDVECAYIVPQGIDEYHELVNWSQNKTLYYTSDWTDSHGKKVLTFDYNVMFTPEGMYCRDGEYGEICEDGKGHYLAHVTIAPVHVWHASLWSFDVEVSLPAKPVNLGSNSDPIAGVEIQMRVDTYYQDQNTGTYSYSWFVQGDGHWKAM